MTPTIRGVRYSGGRTQPPIRNLRKWQGREGLGAEGKEINKTKLDLNNIKCKC